MPAHARHSIAVIAVEWMVNEGINKEYHLSWVAARTKQRKQQKQETESSGRK